MTVLDLFRDRGFFQQTTHPEALEAMLYGLKYRGCSISEQEVKQIARM